MDSQHSQSDRSIDQSPTEKVAAFRLEHGTHHVTEPNEEGKLKRKIDIRIVPSACLIYLLCYLDRANIGNAKVLNHDTKDSLLDSLHLNDVQYTIALMVFLIAYTVFETPSNIMLQKFRPSRWIAFLMLTWGALTMVLGGVKSYGALTAVRFLLGTAEAGLFPGLVYFLTFWYKPAERSLRVALILASSTLAGAFGGAIAYGVGHLNGKSGLEAWRWLFLIEGAPSCASAILVLFYFPDWPETAYWLTDAERALAVSRIRGVSSKGKSKVTAQEIRDTLKSLRLYAHYVAYLCVAVPFSSLSLFSPTIVSGLGYEGLSGQLFTVPPYACAYVVTLLVAFSSDHYNARSLHTIGAMVVAAVAFLIQGLLPAKSFVARYTLLCIASSGSFAAIPPLLGWLSCNLHSTGAAGLAIALNVSFGGPGQIIGVWIYKAVEAPGYRTGHLTNAAVLLFGAIFVFGLRVMYIQRNVQLPEGARKWVL